MALPNLPQNVVDGAEINTAWGNQVAEFVRTVGELVQRGGQLFVTPDGSSLGVLDPATNSSILRLDRAGSTATIRWEENAGFEPWSLRGGSQIPLTKFERFMDFVTAERLPDVPVGSAGKLVWVTVEDRTAAVTTVAGLGVSDNEPVSFSAFGGDWFAFAHISNSIGSRLWEINPLTGQALTVSTWNLGLGSTNSGEFAITDDSVFMHSESLGSTIYAADRGTGTRRTWHNRDVRGLDAENNTTIWMVDASGAVGTAPAAGSNVSRTAVFNKPSQVTGTILDIGVTDTSVWYFTPDGAFRCTKTGVFVRRIPLPFTPARETTITSNTFGTAFTQDGADVVVAFDEPNRQVYLINAPTGLLEPGVHVFRSTGAALIPVLSLQIAGASLPTGTLTVSEIEGLIAVWAQAGNTDQIPVSKAQDIIAAINVRAGTTPAQVRDILAAEVDPSARLGNAGRWPVGKLDSSVVSGGLIDSQGRLVLPRDGAPDIVLNLPTSGTGGGGGGTDPEEVNRLITEALVSVRSAIGTNAADITALETTVGTLRSGLASLEGRYDKFIDFRRIQVADAAGYTSAITAHVPSGRAMWVVSTATFTATVGSATHNVSTGDIIYFAPGLSTPLRLFTLPQSRSSGGGDITADSSVLDATEHYLAATLRSGNVIQYWDKARQVPIAGRVGFVLTKTGENDTDYEFRAPVAGSGTDQTARDAAAAAQRTANTAETNAQLGINEARNASTASALARDEIAALATKVEQAEPRTTPDYWVLTNDARTLIVHLDPDLLTGHEHVDVTLQGQPLPQADITAANSYTFAISAVVAANVTQNLRGRSVVSLLIAITDTDGNVQHQNELLLPVLASAPGGGSSYRFQQSFESNGDASNANWGFNMGNGWNNERNGLVLPMACKLVHASAIINGSNNQTVWAVWKNPVSGAPITQGTTGLLLSQNAGISLEPTTNTPNPAVDLVAGDRINVGLRSGQGTAGTITCWFEVG